MFVRGIKHKSEVFDPDERFFCLFSSLATASEATFIKIYGWKHNYFFKDIIFSGFLWEYGLFLES